MQSSQTDQDGKMHFSDIPKPRGMTPLPADATVDFLLRQFYTCSIL